jgi:tRNA threonylcarbamoyladenosine biosynthesis protein TsaE
LPPPSLRQKKTKTQKIANKKNREQESLYWSFHITSMATQEFVTHSAEETIALGRSLAGMLAPPKLVLLRGDLGAGKTTLVKGIAEAFQAASADDVTSPTFTLIHEYRGPKVNLYHIDLYRIDTPRQLETLGLDDIITDDSILLIEWGEKFERFERERDIEIALTRVDDKFDRPVPNSENHRRIRITSR